MKAENVVLLQLISQEYIMKMGRGYDDMIGCTVVVSVSALCSRYSYLASSLLLPHVI